MSTALQSHLLAAVAFVLFGSTILVVKPSNFSATELVFLRMTFCTIFLLPISLQKKDGRYLWRPRTILCCIATSLAIFLNMLCLFQSFRLAPASTCIALFYCGPIFTLITQNLLEHELPGFSDCLAIILSMMGIGLLLRGQLNLNSSSIIKGYGLALFGGLLFGLIPIFNKIDKSLSPETLFATQSGIASVLLLPFCYSSISSLNASTLPQIAILSLLFTLIPFLLWWKASIGSVKPSPFVSYLDPITTIILSVVIYSEKLTQTEVISMLLLGAAALSHLILKRPNTRTDPQSEVPQWV